MKIKVTTLEREMIEVLIEYIKRYRGTGYGTIIEMNSGVDFYVMEDFDTVYEMIENLKH